MNIKNILLDVDGTLIDSNSEHASAWVNALKHFGITKTYPEVYSLIGMGGDKLIPLMAEVEKDSNLGKRLAQYRQHLFLAEYVKNTKLLPGVELFIDEMKKRGIEMMLATSSNEEELNAMLEHNGLLKYQLKKTTASDARNSKPDPDIILAALDSLKADKTETILIGDTCYDTQAAFKAGITSVAILQGKGNLIGSEAQFTFQNFINLLDNWDILNDAITFQD